jgi:acetylornithine deacetylase/succinyl-diaminopimelate desuccinylase-like protein
MPRFSILLLAASSVMAQTVDSTLADANVRKALVYIDAHTPQTAESLASLARIISPSGKELERAQAVAKRMREIGLHDVSIDGSPNVIGLIPGKSEKALVFVSTLDDLANIAEYQRAAPQPPHIAGDRVVGPGTNTSSTTAAMLAAADALIRSGIVPPQRLIFAAVAQEAVRRLQE